MADSITNKGNMQDEPRHFVATKDKVLKQQWGFPGGANGKKKKPTWQCRRSKRCGFNPQVIRSPEGERGNPLQYS